MRVGDGDGTNPTNGVYRRHRGVVYQRHTIPEHIAVGSLHQERTLPDGKRRLGADADETRFDLLNPIRM